MPKKICILAKETSRCHTHIKIKPEQQAVAEARAVNDKQALDEYSMWRVSVDRRRISTMIRAKSDGEVTQGLMKW